MLGYKKIEVDGEIYQLLQSNIKDFHETPNSVLRRLLGMSTGGGLLNYDVDEEPVRQTRTGRNPQTRLSSLVKSGVLSEGQKLQLIISGKVVSEGKVSGDWIEWNGQKLSMSALAVRFLNEEGYSTEHARGPAYWFTQGGDSIMELWKQYLQQLDDFKKDYLT